MKAPFITYEYFECVLNLQLIISITVQTLKKYQGNIVYSYGYKLIRIDETHS